MINKHFAIKCCCEDISLIENYEAAIKDINCWELHHKAEILPCGSYSVDDLKKFNLYWNRPASELVFMKKHEHHALSLAQRNKKRRGSLNHNFRKPAWNRGKPLSEDTKTKISLKLKGNKNGLGWRRTEETKKKMSKAISQLKWYTNGKQNLRTSKECPRGFWPGKTHHKK